MTKPKKIVPPGYGKTFRAKHTMARISPFKARPVIDLIRTFPAAEIDGFFAEDGYLYFECRHFKTVDGFGDNCLITGEIVAAYAEPEFLRSSEIDDQQLVHDSPLFAYLSPGRFAAIERSNAFPFLANMKKLRERHAWQTVSRSRPRPARSRTPRRPPWPRTARPTRPPAPRPPRPPGS